MGTRLRGGSLESNSTRFHWSFPPPKRDARTRSTLDIANLCPTLCGGNIAPRRGANGDSRATRHARMCGGAHIHASHALAKDHPNWKCERGSPRLGRHTQKGRSGKGTLRLAARRILHAATERATSLCSVRPWARHSCIRGLRAHKKKPTRPGKDKLPTWARRDGQQKSAKVERSRALTRAKNSCP